MRALAVSALSVMVERMELVRIMLISTEASGRTEVRRAMGSTMRVKMTRRGRPLTSAASMMPLSMARMPARMASEA